MGACVTHSHICGARLMVGTQMCSTYHFNLLLFANLYEGLVQRFFLALKCTIAFLVLFWHGTKFCGNPDVRLILVTLV